MEKKIRILTPADALIRESGEPTDGPHLVPGDTPGRTSRRLVRKEHGSEKMSLNIVTLSDGYEDKSDVGYDEFDEIVYVLSGEVDVIEGDGTSHRLTPGSAVFVPAGLTWRIRAVGGAADVVAVFGPARY